MDLLTAPAALSRQENRVVELSMEGFGDKEIAKEMGLSLGTVRTYWKRIQSKVGGQTRAELVATVVRQGARAELLAERTLTNRLQNEISHRRAAEAKFRAICECSPLGIFVCDEEGDCVYVNAAWERITGLTMSQAAGDGWKHGVHSEDRERVIERWRQRVAGNDPTPNEFRAVRPDGQTLWLRTHVSRMVIDGRVLGFVGTIEDVSSRRNLSRESDAVSVN